jgi:hypothetical protein
MVFAGGRLKDLRDVVDLDHGSHRRSCRYGVRLKI